jgi:hypothetical protein
MQIYNPALNFSLARGLAYWTSARIVRHRILTRRKKQRGDTAIACCVLHTGFFLAYFSTQKMEEMCSSETSDYFHRTTRHCVPENRIFHRYRCENLKSNLFFLLFHGWGPLTCPGTQLTLKLSQYSEQAMGWTADFYFRQRQEIFRYATAFRAALGLNQPPIHCFRGAPSPGVKRQVRETDYSSPCTGEVKNGGAKPPVPHMSSCRHV